MVFADDIICALLAVCLHVAVGEMVAGQALVAGETPLRSEIVRGRRGSLPMLTSLGVKSVAELTELLYAKST